MGSLYEYLCTLLITLRSCLLRKRNVSVNNFGENQNSFFAQKSFAVNLPFAKYVEKYGRATQDNTMRSMRIVCWIIKATYTHTEHVILIAFPRQSCLHERASMLR